MNRFLSAVVAFLFVASALAAEPSTGPAIADHGPVYDVADLDLSVSTRTVYRAAFDAVDYTTDGAGINRDLERVARFVNMHARQGVPLENMDLAVVLHGEALKSALQHDAYRQRYGIDNPNLDLLESLAEAGVQFVACGQSVTYRGFGRDELAEPVNIALSAMTAMVTLQADGYALLP